MRNAIAQAGIYFSDVKRARDALLAERWHPSIDAVRAALGNTGSKTTIHRYLREIEVEEGGQRAPVTEAILALVTQPAERLQGEAATELEAMRVQVTRQQGAHERAKSGLKAQLADIRQVLDAASRQLESRQRNLKALKDQLGVEQIARHTAEQHSRDLAARLAEAERHKEAAALATELGTVKQALYLERESGRNLTQKVKQSQAVETRLVILEAQLAHSQTRLAQAEEASVRATELCNELRQQKALLEGQLDGAKSAIALEERLAKLCYKKFDQVHLSNVLPKKCQIYV